MDIKQSTQQTTQPELSAKIAVPDHNGRWRDAHGNLWLIYNDDAWMTHIHDPATGLVEEQAVANCYDKNQLKQYGPFEIIEILMLH